MKRLKNNHTHHQMRLIEILNILSALNSKKIYIILYIHNDFENADKCINNILENTKINFELILIDDCSTDRIINTLGS
jgi:glycosyltransferase involved in cell wall biosynthesis